MPALCTLLALLLQALHKTTGLGLRATPALPALAPRRPSAWFGPPTGELAAEAAVHLVAC